MAHCRDFDVCGLEDAADPAAGLCILHSRRPDKDPGTFALALERHRKSGASNFTRMVFSVPADFSGAAFATAFFHGAVFLDSVDFSGVSFEDAAFFHGTLFAGEATFTLASFSHPCSFSRTRFRRAARFHGVAFGGPADFSGAAFEAESDFGETSFSDAANFAGAVLQGEATFRGATFDRWADFSGATFQGRPTFRHARFAVGVSFLRVDLASGGDFRETTFGGEGIDFGGARFGGRSQFSGRREAEEGTPAFAGVPVSFQGVRIEEAEGITLHMADLRSCRLLDSDARGFRFVRPLWPKMPGREGRLGVFDEVAPREGATARPWGRLEALYRDLWHGAAAQEEFDRNGDFRYGELEMRRRNPATPGSVRRLLSVYGLLAGYGERHLRPLAWAAGLWVLAAAGYLALGLLSVTGGTILDPGAFVDWLRALHFSLAVMTLTTPWDLVPLGYAKGIQILQHLGGPLLLALAVQGAWRRLRR